MLSFLCKWQKNKHLFFSKMKNNNLIVYIITQITGSQAESFA